jgi:hypothetical protein
MEQLRLLEAGNRALISSSMWHVRSNRSVPKIIIYPDLADRLMRSVMEAPVTGIWNGWSVLTKRYPRFSSVKDAIEVENRDECT